MQPTTFADFGIDVQGRTGPEVKTLCPQCSHLRKKKTDTCLSVNIDKEVWKCHNCGWKGSLRGGEQGYSKPKYEMSMSGREGLIKFFAARGISEPVIDRYKISAGQWKRGESVIPVVKFPYFRQGQVINVKTRGLTEKVFKQESGAEKIFYGLDDIAEADCVYIVEGEIDKLSFAEAGITSVLSVPDGAPEPGSDISDKKFEYISNCWRELDRCKKFVIAVDNDEPGQLLSYHLVRRLGLKRCFLVKWPDGCKDANEVLINYGVSGLLEVLEAEAPVPIPGQVSLERLEEDAWNIYANGLGSGLSTGYPNVDEIFRLAPGRFNVVSGIPGHGKSEFLDNLMINSAKEHQWVWSIYSPENFPVGYHWLKLAEKWAGFPIFNPQGSVRLPEHEVKLVSAQMKKHIIINECSDGSTFDDLLSIFKLQILRFGVNACIIDPWNALDHEAGMKKMSETQYINLICNKARAFCLSHDVALFIVVHPSKLKRNQDGHFLPPSPYDMAGSAHWRNRTDHILCVHRNIENGGEDREEALAQNSVEIISQKARHRHLGKIGSATLYWDSLTGRYSPFCFEGPTPNEPLRDPREVYHEDIEPRFPGHLS